MAFGRTSNYNDDDDGGGGGGGVKTKFQKFNNFAGRVMQNMTKKKSAHTIFF